MSSFMEKMMVKADTMIDRLELTEFKPDPIAGMAASRYASVIGSMQKRHGYYLEYGFRESLREHDYIVWTENKFSFSEGHFCNVDALIFRPDRRILEAWEIKRGGALDAPKAEKVAERIHAVQTNLKAYGATKGFIVDAAKSYYLPYYVDDIAKVNVPLRPWLLLQNRLDEHFGFGMVAMIEDANAYFQTKFRSLVPDAQ